jgi:two-component system OmpR family response regulator
MTRMLVVDDDPSVGAAIVMTLGHEGYDTVHAPDAGMGMRAFESSRFHLVIIDTFLPDISGLDIIAELRRKSPAIPILAISGFIFRDSMDPVLDYLALATKAGAAACLRKPFASWQLIAAVRASVAPALLTMAF